MKKSVLIICVGLLAVASTVQATPIQSITATTAVTNFVSVGGTGLLTMVSQGGINIEDTSNVVTTETNGSFSLYAFLGSDTSSSGIARGNFSSGAFSYNDSGNNPLLSGTITSFSLTEFSDGSGILVGTGYFNVTGGTLQNRFGSLGKMVDISFVINPTNVNNFSASFNGSSNMTVMAIPEPATIALLIPAILALRKRNKK